MGGVPAGASGDEWQPERVFVIVSDNKWRLNELKDSTGQLAELQLLKKRKSFLKSKRATIGSIQSWDKKNMIHAVCSPLMDLTDSPSPLQNPFCSIQVKILT